MNLKFLSSKNKLFVGFILIVLICLIVIIINQTLKNRQLQMNNELLVEKNTLIQMQKINRLGNNADGKGAYYLLASSNDEKDKYLRKYREYVELLKIELEDFRTSHNRPENISIVSNFEKDLNKYLQDNELAFQLEKEGHVDKAKAVFIEINFEKVIKNFLSMRDQQKVLIEVKQHEIGRYTYIVEHVNTGITIAFILFTIALGWILSRKIQLEYHIETEKLFYQNTSHELKTPLMSIQGYAQAILDGTIQGEKVNHSLKVIISESDRIKKMVNEMILLSKLDNKINIFEWKNVPVDYLIEESIFRIDPLLKEKGVAVILHPNYLNVSKSPLVRVDSERCLQALLNILNNALRYAINAIDISITEIAQQILIDIKDDGEGIPEEILSHVFERFFKGKNGEDGLGLAIAQAIIEQCGGSIKAWNHEDGGAVFRIMLPTIIEIKHDNR